MQAINLTPWRQQHYRRQQYYYIGSNCLIIITTAIIILLLHHHYHHKQLDQLTKQQQSHLLQLEKTMQHNRQHLQKQQQYHQQADRNQQILNTLIVLAQNMPDNVKLNFLQVNTNDLEVKGETDDHKAMQQLSQIIFSFENYHQQRQWHITQSGKTLHFAWGMTNDK